ncbi:MAG: hypothetical protein COT00_00480, partial [Candidatus Omnitrophica bacterium CG07_land_8_20_14_0_80_50_8]
MSAGIQDGWNAGLFANDESVGNFNYNYWRAPSDRWTGRGYDVAVLDAQGKLVKSELFDVWGLGSPEADRMAKFIEDVPQGYYVLMAIGDEGANNMTERAFKAIESVGSAKIRSLTFRGSWGLIGKKGAPVGTAIEDIHAQNQGIVYLQSYQTQYAYYDKSGTPIPYDQFTKIVPENWVGSYQTYVGDSAELIKSTANGYAIAYRKNYNEFYPESGFIQLWNDRYLNQFSVGEYAQGVMDTLSTVKNKYVFYDTQYPFNYVDKRFAIALKNILAGKGYTVIDANQLAEVMKTAGPDTAVVMSHDIMPDTIYDPNSPFSVSRRKLARTYMNHGGTLLWMGDVPFYYTGHADGTKSFVGEIGTKAVLGVTPLERTVNDYVDTTNLVDFSTTPAGWILSSDATVQNGFLNLSSSDPNNPAAASQSDYAALSDSPVFTVNFKNNTLNSGFQLACEFQQQSLYKSVGIRQLNGVFEIYGATVTGNPPVYTSKVLGQLPYINQTDYTIVFQMINGNLALFLYPKGQEKPSSASFVVTSMGAGQGMRLSMSIQQGQALVDDVTTALHQLKSFSPQQSSVTPDFGLKG